MLKKLVKTRTTVILRRARGSPEFEMSEKQEVQELEDENPLQNQTTITRIFSMLYFLSFADISNPQCVHNICLLVTI